MSRIIAKRKDFLIIGGEKIAFSKKISLEEFESFKEKLKTIYVDRNIFEKIPVTGTGYVISDLHANISALEKILSITNFCNRVDSGESVTLIFMGDYIDKGKNNLVMLYSIFKLKTLYPDNIILLRGNHETNFFMSRFMTFKKEIKRAYQENHKKALKVFSEIFDYLPVIAISDNGIVAMHGGPPNSLTLYGLTHIGLHEILWSDIKKNRNKKRKKTSRSMYRLGKGRKISIFDVDEFLENLGMTFLFRGHSHTLKGVEITSDNIMTVISANSLERFGASLGRRGQAGFVEIDLAHKLEHISQVKTIFLD